MATSSPSQNPYSIMYEDPNAPQSFTIAPGAGVTPQKLSPMDRAAVSPDVALRQQYAKQLGIGLGVSAAATTAQIAAAAWNTDQDRRNNAELEKLNAAHAKGQLAATPQAKIIEEQHRQGLARAGGIQREAQQAAGARIAATGGTTSAADIRTMEEGAARPAQEAALAVNQANTMARLQEMGRQLDRADSATAYKSERVKERRQAIAQGIGQVAGLAGQVAAAQHVKKVDWGDTDPTMQIFYMRAFTGRDTSATNSLYRTTPASE